MRAVLAPCGRDRYAVKKLIIFSIILASIAIPAHAARTANAPAGLRKALIRMLIFEAIYVLLLTQVWTRLH